MGEARVSFISESDYLAGEELPGLRHEYVKATTWPVKNFLVCATNTCREKSSP